MKRIISLVTIAVLFVMAVGPTYAHHVLGHGLGNQGNGIGNTGPGNQGNGPNPGAGNAGGNGSTVGPTTSAAPSQPTQQQREGRKQNWAPFVSTGLILLGFMCEKEQQRLALEQQLVEYVMATGDFQLVEKYLEYIEVKIDDELGGGSFTNAPSAFATAICEKGDLPDAFESYAQ